MVHYITFQATCHYIAGFFDLVFLPEIINFKKKYPKITAKNRESKATLALAD